MKLPHSEITIRALKDPRFRKRVQAKPRKAIEETFDIQVPKSVKLKVVEDNPELVHLIVPSEPGERGREIGVIGLTLDQMRSDPAFKATVIDDPKGTLEQITGAPLPDRPKVVVLEDTADLVHVHLPLDSEESFDVDPDILTSEVYGGGGGPYEAPPEPPTDEDTSLAGNNSSLVQCCKTDIINTVSAWDCCPEDAPTGGQGPITPF